MSQLGAVHFVFALVALAAGAWVLLIPKGTRWHRSLGHVYVTSMLALNVTALFIYRLSGSFGLFHVFALFALATLSMALVTVLGRWPRKTWIEHHATWMAWSYVGLVAAALSETATRWLMPVLAPRLGETAMIGFWSLVAVATLAVVFTGQRLIKRRLPGAVASTPAAMRQEREGLRAREDGGSRERSAPAS